MKTHVIVLALFVFCMERGFCQFQRTYGTTSTDIGKSLTRALGGSGYVEAGYTTAPIIGGGDAYLTRTDNNGNLLWTKTYGGINYDYFNSVRLNPYYTSSQVAYVAAGYTNSFAFGNPGTTDAYLVGTDLNGTPLFSKIFGGKETDRSYCVQPIVDPVDGPGYILVGETNSFGLTGNLSSTNVFVVRTDLFGNLKDAAIFGTKYVERGYWIEQTSDRGYIVTGYTTAPASPADNVANANILVLKLDPKLNIQWDRIFGGPTAAADMGYSIKEYSSATQRGYVLTGLTRSFGQGNGDAFLLNLDLAGNLLWFKTYGAPNAEQGLSLLLTKNPTGQQEFIVAGSSSSFSATSDAYVFKTDWSGSLLWTRVYGGSREDYLYEIIHGHLPGPGYATAGLSASFSGNQDSYLSALTNAGFANTNCERYVTQLEKRWIPYVSKALSSVKLGEYTPVQSIVKQTQLYVRTCVSITARESFDSDEATVEIEEEMQELSIAPNPVSGSEMALRIPANFEGAYASILNMEGKVVKEISQASQGMKIGVDDLEPGIYFLRLTNEGGEVKSLKFVVQ